MKQPFLFYCSSLLALFLIPISIHAQDLNSPSFSQKRGFYSNPFQLQLSSESGATIYYTTDGRNPSNSSGNQYNGPISISSSQVIRAIAYNNGQSSKIASHTFIFLDQVIRQPKNIPGWPNKVYPTDFKGNSATMDYEMDSSIVDDPAYRDDLMKGLTDIPTLCLALNQGDFWTMNDGWQEKATSVEILYPNDPAGNHQIDGGIQAMSHKHQKRSYRLEFKAIYGATNFKSDIMRRSSPINSENVSNKFDQLVLRAGTQRSWARNWVPNGAAFMRDQWYRDSQIEMSGISSHGTYVHLYINGVYFGFYNLIERPNKGFMQQYMGGDDNEWFVFNHNGNLSGDPSRWNYLITTLVNKDLSTSSNYEELKTYVDLSHFIDYLIATWMSGMVDWPGNNYYGSNRYLPEAEPMFFWAWDGEQSWDNELGANEGSWVHKDFRREDSGGPPISSIFNAAKHNEDFMVLFADRVYAHCFNDGPMTDDNQRARWATLAAFIRDVVVVESARWGDGLEDGVTRTRDEHWQNEVTRVDAVMDGNIARFMQSLDEEGYYPSIEPPFWNQHGGVTDADFELQMDNPNASGTIYYRMDGGDPRLAGGGLAEEALSYQATIPIDFPVTVSARVKNGNQWSALRQAKFEPLIPVEDLYINEWLASNEQDTTDASGQYEDWIELYNASDEPMNIAGLFISDNLNNPTRWQIPATDLSATLIEPGGFLLLWADKDPEEGPTHLDFRLSASGEVIGIFQNLAGNPSIVDLVSFGPQTTDISQGRIPDGSSRIQSFASPTPARSNVVITPPSSPLIDKLFINEFLASNENGIKDTSGVSEDWVELYNADSVAVDVGGLYMTDDLAQPLAWRIPDSVPTATTIAAGGFLRLWADKDPEEGVLHLDFKLKGAGEAIALVQLVDTLPYFIDSLQYGEQLTDISYGRFPDGSQQWELMITTTPGATNVLDSIVFDCANVPNGTSLIDSCGVCKEANDPLFNICQTNDSVLFVIGGASMGLGDAIVQQELSDLGYIVETISDLAASASDADGKAVVLISSSVSSSRVNRKFVNVRVPVICWDPFVYDDMLMTGAKQGIHFQFVYNQSQITITEPSHALAAGLSGNVEIVSGKSTIPWGVPTESAIKIGSLANNATQYAIFAYEENSPMIGDFVAPAKRVGFFLHDHSPRVWTAEAKQLLEAAMCWTVGCATSNQRQILTPNQQLQFYPNPAQSSVQVEWKSWELSKVEFQLMDMMGKVYRQEVWEAHIGYMRKQVDLSALIEGIYIIGVKQGNKYEYDKLIIKK